MPELPKRLLKDVLWMLRPILYTDREEFAAAVRDYHMRILDSDERWRPHERVLASRKITLCFECWKGDHEHEIELKLETQDPEGWTTLDLLFAVHQRVVDHLTSEGATLGDHCFFEGLSLRSGEQQPPVYDLRLGS